MDDKSIVLGSNAKTYSKELAERHIKSKIHPDTLFHFMGKLEYLVTALRNKCLSPRYCIEDIGYLQLPIKRIAILMKCFCDINFHKLKEHVDFYGYYGIAFEKEWGIEHGIQPIQYINPKSYLKQDFRDVFSACLREKNIDNKVKNYLLHQLVYYKPIQGKIKKQGTNKKIKKCFTDECEWRYIPLNISHNFSQVYADEKHLKEGILSELSDSIENVKDLSLNFDHSNIKYIIVKTESDRSLLIEYLNQMENVQEKMMLISKIVVWDSSEGDF